MTVVESYENYHKMFPESTLLPISKEVNEDTTVDTLKEQLLDWEDVLYDDINRNDQTSIASDRRQIQMIKEQIRNLKSKEALVA